MNPKKSDIDLAHDIAKIVYEQLREHLERDGTTTGLHHYEELSKKYNGDLQIKKELDFLFRLSSIGHKSDE
jgi:hypothetical protein